MDSERFLSIEEIYLFNRGELYKSYTRFGAHIIEEGDLQGTFFAVWVPEAERVSVVGDFNNWSSQQNEMSVVNKTGVWTLFIPKILLGQLYKFEIHLKDGSVFLKSDPFAFYSELRPLTASRVYSLEGYTWLDQEWISQRQTSHQHEKPLLIYEVHLGSWRRKEDGGFYNWRDFAEELLKYVLEMGYTHIELMPIMEHPYDGSWGYQVTGYYSCTSRYGNPHDFMYFIDRCHQAGIGVILDWVPGHFVKDAHGLGRFNGTSLYEKDEHGQWGTYNFDFSKMEVWSFLISNALFWLDTYHLDGLRVDGVSSMLYLDYEQEKSWQRNVLGGRENLQATAFMQRLNEVVFRTFPGALMIAEEATDWPLVTAPTYLKGLGYNFKWNMGWMNDTLRYMQLEFPRRKDHHNLLTFSLTYAFSENFVLPLSHDEVVHGKRSLLDKMPGDYWQKFAGLRSLMGYFMGHPGKKLMFMGGEFAQFIEWRYDAELDWHLLEYEMHKKYQNYVRDLFKLYRREKALWENDHDWSGFEWLDADNKKQSIFVFCRRAKDPNDFLIVVINLLPNCYENFQIGVPQKGNYQEIFNSDREIYGGSNQYNPSLLITEDIAWRGQACSLRLKVPPLAIVMIKLQEVNSFNKS